MNIKELISESSLIYSNKKISDAISNIADNCNSILSDQEVTILPVMNGALIFSGQLIPKLNFHCKLDYIHASRYLNNEGQKTVNWIYEPNLDLIKNKTVLVIDDILDEGNVKDRYIISGFVYNCGNGFLVSPNIRKSNGDDLLYKLNFQFKF